MAMAASAPAVSAIIHPLFVTIERKPSRDGNGNGDHNVYGTTGVDQRTKYLDTSLYPELINNDDVIAHLRTNVTVKPFGTRIRFIIILLLVIIIGIIIALYWLPQHFAGSPYGIIAVVIGICLCCCPILFKCCSIRKMATTEFRYGDVSIKTLPNYRDETLLREAWSISPYRSSCIFWQPIEGYCGMATVNTMLWSITSNNDGQPRYCVNMPSMPRPFSLNSLHHLIQTEITSSATVPIDRIDVISGALSHTELINVLNDVNGRDSRIRVLCNFHRSPLFFAHSSCVHRWKKIFSGHWSPIGSYLSAKDLVLVLDVNRCYSSYMVSSYRLWQSIHTRDFGDGQWRGLLRIVLR